MGKWPKVGGPWSPGPFQTRAVLQGHPGMDPAPGGTGISSDLLMNNRAQPGQQGPGHASARLFPSGHPEPLPIPVAIPDPSPEPRMPNLKLTCSMTLSISHSFGDTPSRSPFPLRHLNPLLNPLSAPAGTPQHSPHSHGDPGS